MITAFRTDVGRIRAINEDRAAVQRTSGGVTLAVLADGMGGHQAGDIASQTTVEVIVEELSDRIRAEMSESEWEKALEKAIGKANSIIYTQASLKSELAGMGDRKSVV